MAMSQARIAQKANYKTDMYNSASDARSNDPCVFYLFIYLFKIEWQHIEKYKHI